MSAVGNRRAVRDGGALLRVGGVGEAGGGARSLLDDDLEARLEKARDGRRNHGDAGFARPRLPGNPDFHASDFIDLVPRRYFFSHSTIAATAAAAIFLSGRPAYSDTSPVAAGTSR